MIIIKHSARVQVEDIPTPEEVQTNVDQANTALFLAQELMASTRFLLREHGIEATISLEENNIRQDATEQNWVKRNCGTGDYSGSVVLNVQSGNQEETKRILDRYFEFVRFMSDITVTCRYGR